MTDNEALKMNLAALRKVDSSISSIVDNASQVALYKYISESSRWEKTEIEGTLFVYMRSQKPQHGFMVMNRLSTTNLVEPITENLDFQDQTPFLLYRNGKGHIYGIWFYEEKSCLKIFKLLMSLSKLAFTKPDKSNSIRQRSYSESNRKQPKQDNAQTDIISLLTRAQDEYDKKSSAAKNCLWRNSKNSQHAANGDIVKPTPVRVNGAVASNSDLTPLTVGMLFARAGDKEKKPDENTRDFESRVKSFSTSSFKEPSGDSKLCSEAILQSLMSNSAHTLQHIESRQNNDDSYVEEKKGSSEPRALSAGERMLSVETLEKDLKEKLNLLPKTNCDMKIDSKVGVTTELKEPAKSEPIDIPILTPAMLELSSFSSVPTTKIGSLIETIENASENCNASFPVKGKDFRSYSPNQLLSPMDFTVPCRKKKSLHPTFPSSYSPELGTTFMSDVLHCGNGNSNEDLLHPHCLINGSVSGNVHTTVKPSTVTPLNRDQLREALIYMLQNDEDFVIQLHECYVKRLKSQLHSVNSS